MVTMKRSCSCSMPGVWRAVAHNEGAVVIYHSPKACGHVTRDMDLGGHYYSVARRTFVPNQYTAPLITSKIREEHSIFGGADQLRQCIDYVVKRYKPKYIMIANSCVAGVIGDDVQAVADDAERDWGVPVMAVPCSGFLDGEYYAGFYYAAKALVDRFMDKQPTNADTVTLLGDRGGSNVEDTKEIRRLLDFFGLRVHCRFPVYASLEEIGRVPSSALCIPLGGRTQSPFSIRRLAAYIQENFGIPFLDHDYPVGWLGTKAWIRHLGEFLGRQHQALLVEKEQEKRLKLPVTQCRANMQKMRAVLCIGRPLIHFQPDWVIELIGLAGIRLEAIVLFSGLTQEQRNVMRQQLKKYTSSPIFEEEEGEALIQTADLLITTHELENETKRQLFLPVLPPLGVGGMVRLVNQLARLARQPEGQGVVLYGW